MLGLIKTYRKVIFAVILVIGFALGVVNGDQLISLLASSKQEEVKSTQTQAYQVQVWSPKQAQNHCVAYSLKA